MSRSLWELIPDAQSLLALQPEELGEVVLQVLNSEPSWGFNRVGLFQDLIQGLPLTHPPVDTQALEALAEAIHWLESQGLLASRPVDSNEVLFVTRRGRSLRTSSDFAAFRHSTLLPSHLLHAIIGQRARAAFLRGEYDTAVFTAFKAVEVAVRNAAGLPNNLIGTQLMSTAFHPENGPLTAREEPEAERAAVRNLFVGAIGYYKNPQSHRDEPVPPEDACHLLMFASYLLRIVDIRAADRALETGR